MISNTNYYHYHNFKLSDYNDTNALERIYLTAEPLIQRETLDVDGNIASIEYFIDEDLTDLAVIETRTYEKDETGFICCKRTKIDYYDTTGEIGWSKELTKHYTKL
jgi:hypothetical protein